MRWVEKPEILSYIIECYQGTEQGNAPGVLKRQFIWQEPSGDVVIGNSRAFSDHVRERFKLPPNDKSWMAVHDVLRALGEVVQVHVASGKSRGKKFKNQQPEIRIIKRRS